MNQDQPYDIAPGSRLAVIQVRGPIYNDWNGAWASQAARQAAMDPEVSAAVVVIDSPGGGVRGASDLVSAFRALAASKPMHAVTSGNMASLAYMLGYIAGEIAVTPMAVLGSIGVRGGTYYDTSEAMAKEGIKVHVVASDPAKALGTPGIPITDDMLQPEREMVAAMNAEFVQLVATNRRMKPEAIAAMHAGVYAGRDAVRLGLADRIVESTDDYIRELAAKYPASMQLNPTGRVPGNIAARAAGASLMSETTSTASAPAETAAASATPAIVTASIPAAKVPATIADLAANIDDKAFCFDALTKGLTLVEAQGAYIAALKATKPAAVVPTGADPIETGARPAGNVEKPLAVAQANDYLEACRKGANPIELGRTMFTNSNAGAIAGKKRPAVFTSPEQQYAR